MTGPLLPIAVPTPGSPSTRRWHAGTLTYTFAGVITLFLWLLLGDFSWSIRERSVSPLAQWYLKQLEVSNFLFGLIISSLPAVIGLVLTPIISYRSDRHRGPRGRRIPYLMTTTPITALGMVGMALTPLLGPRLHGALGSLSPGLHVVLLTCFGVSWVIFELAQGVSYALFYALVNDVVPRPLLGRFYGLFRIVSLLDGIVFNYWIFGKVETRFTVIMLAITGVYAVGLTWVCFKVQEGTYPPPVAAATGPTGSFQTAFRTFARECFTHRFYLLVFLAITFGNLSVIPINAFSLPYAKSLGLDMTFYGRLFAFTFISSLTLAYLMGWLADTFHPLRVAIVAQIAFAVVTLWGACFARTAATFTPVFVLQGVLAGCYNTGGGFLIGLRLFPSARYAQFASVASAMLAVSTMVVAPTVGKVIDLAGNNYRHAFTASFIVAAVSVVLLLAVYRDFKMLGGTTAYAAPAISGPASC